jgi:hypothetical protein
MKLLVTDTGGRPPGVIDAPHVTLETHFEDVET